jgi:UDP-N-acetylmuramate dehydrogenase
VQILFNFPLKSLNSFGFDVKAQEFICVQNTDQLLEAVLYAQSKNLPYYFIGGGSNVLLKEDLPGLTIQLGLLGKSIVHETASHFFIDVAAGESWHDFVEWTLDQNIPGLENLALIPGTCGAAPIQNIGAYGSEIAHWIDSVEVLNLDALGQEAQWQTLANNECHFKYRHSIFKEPPQRLIVTQMRLAIPKQWQANLQYAELANYFLHRPQPTPRDIFDAVCAIRNKKLPDPKLLGNAGSFFHNPIVPAQKLHDLQLAHPQIVAYPSDTLGGQRMFKLAAGWLIDACGLKGYRHGNVGVYEKQALVLVNYGDGTGAEVLELAQIIQEKIHAKFGVDLTQEPVLLPNT